MENLNIEATTTTPGVIFNAESGELSIVGKSTIEYPFEFYENLINWVGQYSGSAKPKTHLLVSLEYCNTSSSKCLLNFLKKVAVCKDNGSEVAIKWVYDKDDEDTRDTGSDFSRLIKIPFEFEEKR